MFEVIIVTLYGVVAPASDSSCFAFAGSCGGHTCAASEVNSLFGETGEHATVFSPLKIDFTSASRSIDRASACRTFGSLAIGVSSDLSGLPMPLAFAMLTVRPWYPSDCDCSTVMVLSFCSDGASWVDSESATWASPDFRLAERILESVMIRYSIASRCTFAAS